MANGRNLLEDEQISSGKNLLPDQSPVENMQQEKPLFTPKNFLTRRISDVLAGGANFSQGVNNAPYNIAKQFGASPETLSKLPQPTNIDWSAYFGQPNPSLLSQGVQAATSYLPAALMGGTGILGQAAAGGGYGLTHADNPLIGAITGAALGGTGATVPKVASSLFGKGTPSNISKTIAEKLRPSAINDLKDTGGEMYESIFNKLPENENIYDKMNSQSYKGLSSDAVDPIVKKMASTGVKLADDLFSKNPTPRNAHSLYKQLGEKIGEYNTQEARAGTLSDAKELTRSAFRDARGQIANDLESYMSTQDPELFSQFKGTNEWWKKNVVPREKLSTSIASMGEKPEAKVLFNKLKKAENLSKNIAERVQRPQNYPEEISDLLTKLQKSMNYRKYGTLGIGGAAAAAVAPHWLAKLLGGL